jgi:lysyl-tRNA synthetase class 2
MLLPLPVLLAMGALVLSSSRPVLTRPSRSELASAAITMRTHRHPLLCATKEAVVSPFVEAAPAKDAAAAPAAPNGSKTGPLELTLPNVELVLDEMRPYLIADGGNVAVRSIEGGVVKLELQGACGSCPSSTMTMKMGLERGLLERFPTIVSVEQVAQEGPVLDEAGIEAVLQEIRPFLKMTGGTVELRSLKGDGLQPMARLSITGSGATINSVRVEIAQRLKRKVCLTPTPRRAQWPARATAHGSARSRVSFAVPDARKC